jgi:hypothetical protein
MERRPFSSDDDLFTRVVRQARTRHGADSWRFARRQYIVKHFEPARRWRAFLRSASDTRSVPSRLVAAPANTDDVRLPGQRSRRSSGSTAPVRLPVLTPRPHIRLGRRSTPRHLNCGREPQGWVGVVGSRSISVSPRARRHSVGSRPFQADDVPKTAAAAGSADSRIGGKSPLPL